MAISQGNLSWEVINKRLENSLTTLLLTNLHRFTEHQLIKTLVEAPFLIFNKNSLRANLDLFRTHFILFHVLYKLRKVWAEERKCWLEISPLLIGVNTTAKKEIGAMTNKASAAVSTQETDRKNAGEQGRFNYVENDFKVTQRDPVADYYLDLNNLTQASEHSVDRLLNHFWQEYLNPNQKQSALNVLQCSIEDSPEKIKTAYRKLAMTHHPDRGGSASDFGEIQDAYQLLKLYYHF